MHETAKEFWEILNDFEDHIRGGHRKKHEPVPGDIISMQTAEEPVSVGNENTNPRDKALMDIAAEISVCDKCKLCEERTKTVPGAGVLDPLVMFIGEGPGADEDRSGIPFVGKAGQYLDKWLGAIGLDRTTNCFIGNVVKCRPPRNRDPEPGEMDACLPYLYRQIDAIRPKVIVTLGRISSQVLCGSKDGIGRLRGGTYDYLGIPIVPTYHPSGVLRNPEYRAPVWDDLKTVQNHLQGNS